MSAATPESFRKPELPEPMLHSPASECARVVPNDAGRSAHVALQDISTETNDDGDDSGAEERLPDRAPVEMDSVTSDVIVSAGAENRPTAVTELLRAEAGDVRADMSPWTGPAPST